MYHHTLTASLHYLVESRGGKADRQTDRHTVRVYLPISDLSSADAR